MNSGEVHELLYLIEAAKSVLDGEDVSLEWKRMNMMALGEKLLTGENYNIVREALQRFGSGLLTEEVWREKYGLRGGK